MGSEKCDRGPKLLMKKPNRSLLGQSLSCQGFSLLEPLLVPSPSPLLEPLVHFLSLLPVQPVCETGEPRCRQRA